MTDYDRAAAGLYERVVEYLARTLPSSPASLHVITPPIDSTYARDGILQVAGEAPIPHDYYFRLPVEKGGNGKTVVEFGVEVVPKDTSVLPPLEFVAETEARLMFLKGRTEELSGRGYNATHANPDFVDRMNYTSIYSVHTPSEIDIRRVVQDFLR